MIYIAKMVFFPNRSSLQQCIFFFLFLPYTYGVLLFQYILIICGWLAYNINHRSRKITMRMTPNNTISLAYYQVPLLLLYYYVVIRTINIISNYKHTITIKII